MTELAHFTEHESVGAARLITRFKGSNAPLVVAATRIVLRRIQHLEDVLWDVYTLSWLDTAEGVQLDNLGAIVGEPRKGRGDDQYRVWIRARIAINRGNGKVSDVLKVARLVLGEGPSIEYVPRYPAAYEIEVLESSADMVEVAAILNEARGAGIGFELHATSVLQSAHTFTFAEDDTPGVLDTDKGFGDDTDALVGGQFSDVV